MSEWELWVRFLLFVAILGDQLKIPAAIVAGVMELVDIPDLKSGEGNLVPVRVWPPAP